MSNYYNIDKNAHYFILMHPLENVLGLIYYTSSNTPEKWVECVINEDRYKIDDGYKITLQSIEEGYGRENYYQCDFDSLVKAGYIIKKTSPSQHVKFVKNYSPLTDNVYLVNEGWIVTD